MGPGPLESCSPIAKIMTSSVAAAKVKEMSVGDLMSQARTMESVSPAREQRDNKYSWAMELDQEKPIGHVAATGTRVSLVARGETPTSSTSTSPSVAAEGATFARATPLLH